MQVGYHHLSHSQNQDHHAEPEKFQKVTVWLWDHVYNCSCPIEISIKYNCCQQMKSNTSNTIYLRKIHWGPERNLRKVYGTKIDI